MNECRFSSSYSMKEVSKVLNSYFDLLNNEMVDEMVEQQTYLYLPLFELLNNVERSEV